MSNSEILSLELYLAQIARELRDLPSQARADELREIEAHLRALIEARGDVAATLAQFGAPRRVGRDLRRAWERKQPEAWWRAIVAPIVAVISYVLVGLPLIHSTLDFYVALGIYGFPVTTIGLNLVDSLFILPIGYIAGLISPKRGLLGIVGFLFLSSLSGIIEGNLLSSSWIFFVTMSYTFAIIGAYFGASHSRKLSARIAK